MLSCHIALRRVHRRRHLEIRAEAAKIKTGIGSHTLCATGIYRVPEERRQAPKSRSTSPTTKAREQLGSTTGGRTRFR